MNKPFQMPDRGFIVTVTGMKVYADYEIRDMTIEYVSVQVAVICSSQWYSLFIAYTSLATADWWLIQQAPQTEALFLHCLAWPWSAPAPLLYGQVHPTHPKGVPEQYSSSSGPLQVCGLGLCGWEWDGVVHTCMHVFVFELMHVCTILV